jgi:L-arabinokinase
VSAIAYYITGHGYGHAVRSSQVIRALRTLRRDLDIYVRTTAPPWLFDSWLAPPRYTYGAIDVGVVQRDSLAVDFHETAAACRVLYDRRAALIEEELSFMREHRLRLVLGDIPPLAFEIAACASIPSIAITNFTWDFIYRAYSPRHPDLLPLTAAMERDYAKATLALTLPYPCPMKTFARCEAIPWITRSSRLTKQQAREKFGLSQSATIVLITFGGYGLDRLAWQAIARQQEFYFVTTGDTQRAGGNILVLPSAQNHYEDLVRAADVVVTKPGYGIVADAIAHRVPVLYTDRGDFPEYARLVQALKECATAAYISQSDLLAGRLSPHIVQLLQTQENWPAVDTGGAENAARRIIALLDG